MAYALYFMKGMNTLFPLDHKYPSGFQYWDDFITETEERDLLGHMGGMLLHPFQYQGFEAKRKVASFGYDYRFDHRVLTKGTAIPFVFEGLIKKCAEKLHLATEDFAELLVTEYPPGSVINWHRDAPPFALIAGISLQSDCIFKLRPYEKEKQGRGSVISLPVQRRSLYVMEGEVRSQWQHSIAPVKSTRHSITLRTLIK